MLDGSEVTNTERRDMCGDAGGALQEGAVRRIHWPTLEVGQSVYTYWGLCSIGTKNRNKRSIDVYQRDDRALRRIGEAISRYYL